jgi:hypothetical protein
MPGLVPGIHDLQDVDRRDKPGDDEYERELIAESRQLRAI